MGTVNDSWWISYLSNSEYSYIGMIVATEPKVLVIHAGDSRYYHFGTGHMVFWFKTCFWGAAPFCISINAYSDNIIVICIVVSLAKDLAVVYYLGRCYMYSNLESHATVGIW